MQEFQSRLESMGREREAPLGGDASDEQRAWRALYWDHHRLRHLAMDPNAYEPVGLAMTNQMLVTDRLSEIECPTRIIIGDSDVDFVRGAGLLADGIPGAVVHELPGIDHQPHQEAKTRFLEILTEHLREVRAG
jgi:pimeloyl-ACP methyl ester carboxylesterase